MATTITVMYRDVPADEIECGLAHPELWPARRGQPIQIQVPAVDADTILDKRTCKGPFYLTDQVNPDGYRCAVCPHIAEIGD